jgi:hypothetical protein
MASAKRPASVSAAMLSKSIDQAVARAAKQFDIRPQQPNLSFRWEIIGRVVRGVDAGQAFELATTITDAVKVRGIVASPTISKVGKGILVGFIERGQLPRSFG